MTPQLYIQCFLVGVLGWAIAAIRKIASMQQTAKKTNIEFSPGEYFKTDWAAIATTFAVIAVMLLTLDQVLHINPKWVDYSKIVFLPTGYMGAEIIGTAMGQLKKKINAAIEYKARQTDEANNTTNAPTPK
jgi:hypothetical protein